VRTIGLLAAVALCAPLGFAQSQVARAAAASSPIPASYKDLKYPALKQIQLPHIEQYTMPNGMRIYLLEDHELPLIRGTALVRTGNLFDPADKVGLATLTGMAIRSGGTSAKTGDQLDEELENIAASVESEISESSASVSFSTLKERTDEVLQTFHDVLTDPAFRENRIELIKSQMRTSISRRNDDAQSISQREIADTIYGHDSPYGWREEYATVDNIKRQDAVDFYKRYYFPANIMLAVQGDFSAPEMKAKLEKLFGLWNYKQDPVPAFPKVNHVAKPGVYLAIKTDVTQTNFSFGQLGGELNSKDYPALEVMSDILGGGFQSRLFQRVRTQMGLAYSIGAVWGAAYDHPGIFEVYGSTKSASTEEAIQASREEINRIREHEVSADELESAKQGVLNGFVFNFDTPSKTLSRLLRYSYFGYPNDFIFQYQKAVERVTQADVLRVAKEYLDPAKFVVVAVGNPKDFDKPLSSLEMPVSNIDLTIPEPKAVSAKADQQSLARGKQMLDKLAQAMGGKAAIQSVKDYVETSTMQLDAAAGGIKLSQTQEWLAPGYFRQEGNYPFGKVVVYSDGKSGWMITPQGTRNMGPTELRQVNADLFRNWFTLLESGTNPDRTVNDAGDNKIEISDKEGHSLLLTIDPATGLPSRETFAEPGSGTTDETFSDWQAAGGVKLPRKVSIERGGKHFGDETITDIRVNTGLAADQMSKKP
jgi:zinc protease